MGKIDIEILNKFYNCKERKKYDSFNLRMKKKKEKRLAKVEKKPLSCHERFLFDNRDAIEETKVKCDGFYKCNGMSHILFGIAKTQSETFYEETRLLCAKYPTSSFIGATIMDEHNKASFLSIEGPNSFGMQHLSEIEPNDPKLSKYVKTILIYAFGISYDSICLDFQLLYNEDFINQFNEMLVSNYKTEIEYKKVFSNGRYSDSFNYPIPEIARSQYADDVLFEIKSRVTEFIRNNYSLLHENTEIPFSVDEYRTNLKDGDKFLNLYGYTSLNGTNLIHNTNFGSKSNSKITTLLLDYWLIPKHHFYDLNRGRILFFSKADERIFADQSFPFVLMFYLQKNEIEKYKTTLNKKFKLFEKIGKGKYFLISRVFKQYADLCLQAHSSQILLDFEKIKLFSWISDEQRLKELIEHLKNETVKLNLRNKELDEKINNILSSKNNALSMRTAIFALIVSVLSAFAAIATLLLSIFCK